MPSTLNEFLEKALYEEKYLNEVKNKEFPIDVIKKIQKMTDRNLHDEARILAAKTIKKKKFIDAYEGIQKINSFFGSMRPGISNVRYEIDKMLWYYLEDNYSNGNDASMAF